MTKYYTLISYITGEEGYHDRCGDYVPGEESEMTITTYSQANFEQFIKDNAKAQMKKVKSNHEITILIDGLNPYNVPHDISDEEELHLEITIKKIEGLTYTEFLILEAEQKKKDEAIKQQGLERKLQQERLARQAIVDAELKQLAALQAKYANNNGV